MVGIEAGRTVERDTRDHLLAAGVRYGELYGNSPARGFRGRAARAAL